MEYNGYAVHSGREAEDDLRAEGLRQRGWLVIAVASDDPRDSTRVEHELRAAFERRGYRWPVC